MSSKEVLRARVLHAHDPLQLTTSRSDEWSIPHDTPPAVEDTDWPSLGKQGKWKKIVVATADFQTYETDKLLTTAAWHVVAQIKLGEYIAAAQTLSTLGDLDAPEYLRLTAQGEVSRIPFALRRAACECQLRLAGPKQSQDALYALMHFCKTQQQVAKAKQEDPKAKPETLESKLMNLWEFREECLAATIFCHHYRLREYDAALRWLSWLRSRHPNSLDLQMTVGCVLLSLGQTQSAAATLQAAVQDSPDTGDSNCSLNKNRNLRGLLLIAQNNLQGAIAEFQAVMDGTPGDRVAANNLAVCHVYAGKIPIATRMLETSMQKHSDALIHEFVVRNLITMYNLLGVSDGKDPSHRLGDWLSQAGPDDLQLP